MIYINHLNECNDIYQLLYVLTVFLWSVLSFCKLTFLFNSINQCSNGEEWYKLRHAVQMMMLRPREVSYYYPLQDGVAKKAVEKLAAEVDEDGVVSDLHTLISQWILECKN